MIKIGGTEIADVKLGSTQVEKVYLGSSLVWEKVASRFIEVEYLKSSGKQYIDTGINCQDIGKIECVLRYPQLPMVSHGDGAVGTSFYGMTGATYESSRTWVFHWGAQYGEGSTEKMSTSTVGTDTLFHKIVLDINNGTLTVDNDSPISITVTSSPPSINWWLFMRNGRLDRAYPAERQSVKIWDKSGQLVRDYKAVRTGSTGYMYDAVSDELIGNTGSGNFMVGPDIGATLPYDAEVEYLQSTGTQYINTGIVPTNDTGALIKVVCSDNSDVYFIGMRQNTGNTRWGIGHSANGFYWCYNSYQTSNRLTGTTGQLWLNYINSKKFNGLYNRTTKEQALSTLSFTPTYPIWLFGFSGQNSTKWKGKIYYCVITEGNNIVMDLIPVRKNGVGYMYDKISKTLYGNAGTGSFTLGPDVT